MDTRRLPVRNFFECFPTIPFHRVGHRGLIDVFPQWLAPDANVLKAMVSFE